MRVSQLKKCGFFAAAFFLCFTLRPDPVHSLGVGVLGTYATSSVKYFYNFSGTYRTFRTIGAGERIGFGLVFDTAVAEDRLINYRLEAVFGFTSRNFSWNSLHMLEFSMFHTFGFGILRVEWLRLWIGPEIGYGTAVDRHDSDNLEAFGTLGLKIGMNFNIGQNVTFFIEGGARLGLYAGENFFLNHIYGSGHEYTGGGGVMFRFDDSYRYIEEL